MIPHLLITPNRKITEGYIKTLILERKIKPYNVFRIEPEESSLKIEQIRDIKSTLIRADPEPRMVIIFDFDTARDEAQNAFLKTLEEKANLVQFVIVVKDKTAVLSTIASRCKTIELKSTVLKINSELTNIDKNSLYENMRLFTFPERDKKKALKKFDEILHFYSIRLHKNPSLSAAITRLIELRRQVDKNNLNPQAALDKFFIEFKSKA